MLDRLGYLVDLEKLKNKRVLIIGLGGVGSYALESIARSGIESITIVDNDVIDITNINRQLFALNSTIGLAKVAVALKRIKDINPNCQVKIIKEFITKDNIDLLFKEKIDYLIDAIDTIDTKKLLIKNCLDKNIKFISSMGTANKMDPTLLKIMDLSKTNYDPIAKILRKYVKDLKTNKKVMVVCSNEQTKIKDKLGSNAYVPATAGLLCASYVINDIVGD